MSSWIEPVLGSGLSVKFKARGGGGGGGTLIFSHIRRLGLFLGVKNSEFQYFWGVFRKMIIFLGYEDFVDIFWGSSQGSFLCNLGSFFKVKVQNWDIFWGC